MTDATKPNGDVVAEAQKSLMQYCQDLIRLIDDEIAWENADRQRKMLAERLANRQPPLVIAEDYGIPILDESDPAREKETS